MCKVCFREKSDTAPIVIGCRYLLSPLSAHSLFSISWLVTFHGERFGGVENISYLCIVIKRHLENFLRNTPFLALSAKDNHF